MLITLGTRTRETVREYFRRSSDPDIRKALPQKAQTVEEALADYEETLLPNASSYGRTICADGRYVGDVWCCCIDPDGTPSSMICYCVLDKTLWNRGIATEALRLFLEDIDERYHFASVGAFTFSDNLPSIRVLEKNGFRMAEEFVEDGVPSRYFVLQRIGD